MCVCPWVGHKPRTKNNRSSHYPVNFKSLFEPPPPPTPLSNLYFGTHTHTHTHHTCMLLHSQTYAPLHYRKCRLLPKQCCHEQYVHSCWGMHLIKCVCMLWPARGYSETSPHDPPVFREYYRLHQPIHRLRVMQATCTMAKALNIWLDLKIGTPSGPS